MRMGMGMDHHLCNTRRESYYAVLGVRPDASAGEIRNAYRKLAMKWHPDRWQRQPRLVDEANRRFQLIQEAYQVLSDRSKRRLYDAGLYDDGEEEEVEGFSDFLEEMLTLMANVRREKQQYSLQELQRMMGDMARSFDSPPAPAPATCWSDAAGGSSRGSKRFRGETEPASTVRTKARVRVSGMGVFGSCC